jgi:hypothetical protein
VEDARNAIQNYMFSEEFTNLDIKEKDVQQRVFYHVREIVQFLVNPMKGANINAAIKQHNKLGSKSDPKEKSNGRQATGGIPRGGGDPKHGSAGTISGAAGA